MVFAFLGLPSFVLADTAVSGAISSDTTWSSSGGVYVIDSSFSVATGTTLTIEPGTIIKAKTTYYGGPSIYGELVVLGTSELLLEVMIVLVAILMVMGQALGYQEGGKVYFSNKGQPASLIMQIFLMRGMEDMHIVI